MITLLTGTTGAGKSLFGIDMILERTGKKYDIKKPSLLDLIFKKKVSDFEKTRPVFYYHIDGLDEEKTGWTEMEDPIGWNNLEKYPTGSLFIIDEAHKWFPKTGKGTLPKYVEDFSEHRHDGYDFLFMTQEQMMVNHHIRSLVNIHIHLERQEGYEANTRYKWNKLGNVKDYHSKQEAQKKRQSFSKVEYVFPLYKSSSTHTSEKTIPFYFYVIPVALIAILILGFRIFDRFSSTDEPEVITDLASVPAIRSSNSQVLPPMVDIPLNQRYQNHYEKNLYLQKGFYPKTIINSDAVYKSYSLDSSNGKIVRGLPTYNFINNGKEYEFTYTELTSLYSLDIDSLTDCRDAIFMPEIKTVYYSTCRPRESFSKPLMYYANGNDSQDTKSIGTPQIRANKTTSPKPPSINPFINMLN